MLEIGFVLFFETMITQAYFSFTAELLLDMLAAELGLLLISVCFLAMKLKYLSDLNGWPQKLMFSNANV